MKKLSRLISSLFAGVLVVAGFSALEVNHNNIKETHADSYTQSVSEYYQGINWDQTGATLKTDLFKKIKITTAGWSYDGLFTAYETTDTREDGTVWDIYSDKTRYHHGDSHSYSKEGDGYNREHVIPQSSFSKAAPMKSDVHHVLPSDGYVNNRRSNHPHGIVSSATYVSEDGFKLGTGTGGTCFEPKDRYKGDIARIYFYFVTCYQDKMSSNSFTAFDGNTYPSIKSTYLNVYLQWAKDDPVDQKEIDRNNAAYAGQGNRNPFIDCPYAVGAIWDSAHATDYGAKGQYTSGDGITISKSTATMISGGTTTISATSTAGGTITWTTSNSSVVSLSSSTSASGSNITLTAGSAGSATITAKQTISGTEYSKTCTVTVSATKQVTSIEISNQKTNYNVDDTFVKPTVTATYNDSTQADVTNSATFTGYDLSTSGSYTVNVSYSYGGATATASYGITVKTSGGGGGESGDEVTLEIDFTGSKSSDTDSKGNVWSATGDYTKGSSYLRLNSDQTYISNSPELSVDTSETMTVKATLRTYGGANSQSLRITAYNEDEESISNTLVLSPSSSSLSEYSGTLTFTNSNDHSVTIKAYSGNNNSLGISGMKITYTEWVSSPKSLTDIGISTSPTKTSYQVSECFDPTGLVISRYYSDGSEDTYSYAGHTSEFTFDPSLATPLTIDDESVEVVYGGFSYFIEIDVEVPKQISSLEIENYTTAFVEGDTFVFGGTVTAEYTDGTSSDVTANSTFTGYDMLTVGNQTVTVHFGLATTTYGITVSAGTLTSIAVSGMTTTYTRNAPFSFDGTCTATFENGYEKIVTPTSVTSPDMSTTGQKTVTVSFAYNNKTKTTSYTIAVNAYRQVWEESESVLGTITYPDNNQTISVETLSVSTSGYTAFEDDSIRLGSGSNTGSATVESTTSNISKVVVRAKAYGSDSGVNLTIGGSSNTITSSYANYSKEYAVATNSVAIATTANKKRANIQSITVYTKTLQDIGQTEDCVGLETFINTYMHMDYTENLGYCKDNEHHYYTTAKTAFNALNTHQRSLFTGNSAYSAEWARLEAWASFNGDVLNSNNLLESAPKVDVLAINGNNESMLFLIIISSVSILTLGAFIYIKKRKAN